MRGCRCSMIMGFTKPIEHFNLQRKKVITMNTLYVGIDVSSKSNVVYLMLPNGDKHSNFSVANSHEGSTLLVKKIYSALTSHSLDTVLIGLEATSVYGDNLVYFLREDATLAPFNRKIHVLNPKQVKKFHDTYNDLPKNDYVDSFVIADCLRFGRINKEVYMGDYRYKALQNLTRARFFAVQNLVKEKQREYYGAAEPPVRCGESHLSGLTEPPHFFIKLLCHCWVQSIYFSHREVFSWVNTFNIDLIGIIRYAIHDGIGKSTFTITDLLVPLTFMELRTKDC